MRKLGCWSRQSKLEGAGGLPAREVCSPSSSSTAAAHLSQEEIPNTISRSNGFKLREGRFRLDKRKKFFMMRAVKHWPRLPREVVDAPSPETSKASLDGALNLTQVKLSLLTAGRSGWMASEGAFQPKAFHDSVISPLTQRQLACSGVSRGLPLCPALVRQTCKSLSHKTSRNRPQLPICSMALGDLGSGLTRGCTVLSWAPKGTDCFQTALRVGWVLSFLISNISVSR